MQSLQLNLPEHRFQFFQVSTNNSLNTRNFHFGFYQKFQEHQTLLNQDVIYTFLGSLPFKVSLYLGLSFVALGFYQGSSKEALSFLVFLPSTNSPSHLSSLSASQIFCFAFLLQAKSQLSEQQSSDLRTLLSWWGISYHLTPAPNQSEKLPELSWHLPKSSGSLQFVHQQQHCSRAMVIISEGICYAKMPKRAVSRGRSPRGHLTWKPYTNTNQGELKASG